MIAPPRADDTTGIAEMVRQLVGTIAWAELSWTDLFVELRKLGRRSVPGGRLAEGHVDALRILQQAGRAPKPGALYGVWASRSRGAAVTASPADENDGALVLSGSMPFASGCGVIDRSLVTVVTDTEPPQNLLVDAPVEHWKYDHHSWCSDAMSVSRSFTLQLDAEPVPADAVVGGPGFYLERPAFLPGGVGVAAVWTGGAQAVLDVLVGWLSAGTLDQVQSLRIGGIALEVDTCCALLDRAAVALDGPAELTPDETVALCTFTRAGIGAAVRRALQTARDCAGPAGAAHVPQLSGVISDLDLYVRQQHADRDLFALARQAVAG